MSGAWQFLVGNFVHADNDLSLFNEAMTEIQAEQRRRDAEFIWRTADEREQRGDSTGADLLRGMARLIDPGVGK